MLAFEDQTFIKPTKDTATVITAGTCLDFAHTVVFSIDSLTPNVKLTFVQELVLPGAAPVKYTPEYEVPSASEVTIGKMKKNSIAIINPSISSTHAIISPDGKFTDKSTNGSYILPRSG
jgi:hypothetical protein